MYLETKNDIIYTSAFLYFLSVCLWISYDPFSLVLQYEWVIKIAHTYMYFAIDGLSLFFIYLTTFLIPLCLLFNWQTQHEEEVNNNFISIFIIEILLLLAFTTTDILMFYIFFETILIPFFIFIGINALRKRKTHASYLLFFYTIGGSIFMLISILMIYKYTGSTDILVILDSKYDNIKWLEHFVWICFFITFAIKIPIFPFHIWLPEAHVEAPTEGSVLLAGLLLKLGAYGILRFLIPMFPSVTLYYSPLVITLSILGIVYTSFITIRQIDIKRIVAYSSIAHMNLCILGIFSFNNTAIAGSILLMISHGLVSGGLFFMIGMLYNRFHTKLIKYYSGLIHYMPIFGTIFFILIISNISMPLTSNFIGEFLIIYGLYNSNNIYGLVAAMVGIFIGTLYSISLFNRIFFCTIREEHKNISITDIKWEEVIIMLPIIIHILWIGIYPNPFLSIINTYAFFNI